MNTTDDLALIRDRSEGMSLALIDHGEDELADGHHSLICDLTRRVETELARLTERWQELEHPFDKSEYDAMYAETTRLREGLREIHRTAPDMPTRLAARALLGPTKDTPAMCKADPASVCTCDEYDLPGRCPRRP